MTALVWKGGVGRAEQKDFRSLSLLPALLGSQALGRAVPSLVPPEALSIIRGVSRHIYFGAAAGCFSE